MTARRDGFLRHEDFSAYRALLAFRQAVFRAGRSFARQSLFRMTARRDFFFPSCTTEAGKNLFASRSASRLQRYNAFIPLMRMIQYRNCIAPFQNHTAHRTHFARGSAFRFVGRGNLRYVYRRMLAFAVFIAFKGRDNGNGAADFAPAIDASIARHVLRPLVFGQNAFYRRNTAQFAGLAHNTRSGASRFLQHMLIPHMRFRIRFRFVRRVAVSAARARIRRVAARRTRRLRHFRFVIVSQRLFANLVRIWLHIRRTAHFARVQHARRIFARRFRMHAFVVLVSQRFRVFLFRVVAAAALQRIMPAFFARRRYIPFVLRIQLQVVTQSFAARYHFRLAFQAAHRALLSDLRRFCARRFDHGLLHVVRARRWDDFFFLAVAAFHRAVVHHLPVRSARRFFYDFACIPLVRRRDDLVP